MPIAKCEVCRKEYDHVKPGTYSFCISSGKHLRMVMHVCPDCSDRLFRIVCRIIDRKLRVLPA